MIEQSILISIKKRLGISENDDSFDEDVISEINSSFSTLNQMGVGTENFCIQDESSIWSDFYTEGVGLQSIKNYVYYYVKLIFDPPSSSTASQAMQQQKDELAWRLNISCDN